MSFKLPDSIHNLDQLVWCVDELRAYAQRLNRASHKLKDGDKNPLSEGAEELLSALKPEERQSAKAVSDLCEQVEAASQKAPAVTVTLAAIASRSFKQELVSWFRTNVSESVLVNFQVNPEIAGGMVLRTTNKIYDFSFRRKLLQHPEGFAKVLSRV